MIAAAAISSGHSLATFNRSDFERFIPCGLKLEG
jgi:predicted nucleic acid-binding protein